MKRILMAALSLAVIFGLSGTASAKTKHKKKHPHHAKTSAKHKKAKKHKKAAEAPAENPPAAQPNTGAEDPTSPLPPGEGP